MTLQSGTIKDMFNSGKLNKQEAGYYFDWDKAAEIISERKPKTAYAGLLSSFYLNCHIIYQNGQPVYPDELIASAKDIPMLALDSFEPEPCYVKEYENYKITWTPELIMKIQQNNEKEQNNDLRGTVTEENTDCGSADYEGCNDAAAED